jgi:transcriptional regulator CtsR
MGITDIIANYILESLTQQEDGVLELQRSDLAQRFHCVPSQINYVMATRFSPERGYIVESRRGGNGYIRISRARVDRHGLLMHVLNSVGEVLDFNSARAIVGNLVDSEVLPVQTGRLMLAAISDNALRRVQRQDRDLLRAAIFKQMLLQVS